MKLKDWEKMEEMIRRVVSQEVEKQLTCEVVFEKVKTEDGIPTGTSEIKKEDMHITLWWIRYLPQYEGAMRGLQKQIIDVRNKLNKINSFAEQLKSMANILISLESAIKGIGQLAVSLEDEKDFQKKLAERNNLKLIKDDG
jgi:hypothetical protein